MKAQSYGDKCMMEKWDVEVEEGIVDSRSIERKLDWRSGHYLVYAPGSGVSFADPFASSS